MIADLNAKIAAADSNTPIATILQYVTEAERLGGGKIIYDSSGVLPSDNAYEGMIAYVADSATLKVRGDYGWAGIADSASVEPYTFQGSVSGYSSGGNTGRNVIDKYPFSSDANAADVGDLILSRQGPSGQSSSASGYSSGGTTPTYQNVIDKFSFSSDGNATDVGDLILPLALSTGNSSENYGYVSLGWSPSLPPPGTSNAIEKFPFASDANSADVGDTIGDRRGAGGQNSSTHGYVSGGVSLAYTADINKFSFTTDGNATDVGDATGARGLGTGQSSSTHGYNSGGVAPSLGPPAYTNSVDKFPFASDANATDVGDLTAGRALTPSSQSSTVSGYTSGGNAPTAGGTSDIIDKFPFSSDANATDVGDLTVAKYALVGNSSETDGYASGGLAAPATVNVIDTFPFASDANATDHGDLLTIKSSGSGQSSTTHGYHSGGIIPSGNNDVIEKFPFANTSGSTDVGVLTSYRQQNAGQSSSTDGYSSGGRDAANAAFNIIEKFPFSTDANSTDVGDLTVARRDMRSGGQSSTVSGYTSGGDALPNTDVIDKFPFATDANATDVGDLTVIRADTAGQQV